MAAQERSQHPQNRSTQSQAYLNHSAVYFKLSTTNADRLQHRWTRQLLRGSALLPRSSTLKLTSLLLASEHLSASRFALTPHSPSLLKLLHSQVQGLRGGMAAQKQSQHSQNRSTFLDRGGGVIARESVASRA